MFEPPYRIKNMMPGMIMLWYGSVATIPSGWAFCDGTLGTPDLRGRFIRNAQSDVGFPTPGTTGGADVHKHDFTGDGHAHDIEAGSGLAAGTDFNLPTSTDPSVGATDDKASQPRFYTLVYIMKL